jgi:hypothetical protein
VTRWVLVTVVTLVLAGMVGVALARHFGRSGGRLSIAVSVVSLWLAAWVLWSFIAGLAAHWGMLAWYDTGLFALLALIGGFWQYRTHVRTGREHGLAVFVGGQLVWLIILLVQNGSFER